MVPLPPAQLLPLHPTPWRAARPHPDQDPKKGPAAGGVHRSVANDQAARRARFRRRSRCRPAHLGRRWASTGVLAPGCDWRTAAAAVARSYEGLQIDGAMDCHDWEVGSAGALSGVMSPSLCLRPVRTSRRRYPGQRVLPLPAPYGAMTGRTWTRSYGPAAEMQPCRALWPCRRAEWLTKTKGVRLFAIAGPWWPPHGSVIEVTGRAGSRGTMSTGESTTHNGSMLNLGRRKGSE